MASTKTTSHAKEKTTSSPTTAAGRGGADGRRSSRPSTPDKRSTASYLKPTASSCSGAGTTTRPSLASAGKRIIASKATSASRTLPATTRTPPATTSSAMRLPRASTSTSSSHSPSPRTIACSKEKTPLFKGVPAGSRAQLTRAKSFDRTAGGVRTSRERARSATPPPPAENPAVEAAGKEHLPEVVEAAPRPTSPPAPAETKMREVEEETTSTANVEVVEVEIHVHEELNKETATNSEVVEGTLPEDQAKEEIVEREEKATENITKVVEELTATEPALIAEEGAVMAASEEEKVEEKKEEGAAAEVKDKKAEASPPVQSANTVSGRRREAPPAGNAVIEERLVAEKRKNKVLALVGAFETVISLQEPELNGAMSQPPRATVSALEPVATAAKVEENKDAMEVPAEAATDESKYIVLGFG